MRILTAGVVAAALLWAGAPALAQEGTQPATAAPADAAAPAAEEPRCKLAQPPARLIITMPKKPALPACAEKNNCSKGVADAYNAAILSYNKSMSRVNEATGDYVDELNDYARNTGRYAQCEIDRLNEIVAAND